MKVSLQSRIHSLVSSAAVAMAIFLAAGCSSQKTIELSTPRRCTLPEKQQNHLRNGLVVQVYTFEDDVTVIKKSETISRIKGAIKGCGSATVIRDNQLMLTDHQIVSDRGYAIVDGQGTEYHVLDRLRGPREGSGCVLVELTTPLSRTLPEIEIDFNATPGVGDTVFVVYCPPPDMPEDAEQAARWRIVREPCEPILVQGRVIPPPEERAYGWSSESLRGFLLLNTNCPRGASGSPVVWQRDNGELTVIGIIAGGWTLPRPHWLTRRPTGEILSKGQTAFQPREYKPVEKPAKKALVPAPATSGPASTRAIPTQTTTVNLNAALLSVLSPLRGGTTPWILGAGGVMVFGLLLVLLRR